jgi:hypothetical protein
MVMLLAAAPARADTPSSQDRALAESLFREAKDLAKAEDYERACPKFAESQRLDPQLGTLLHLATCHEQQGKTASAWAEYSAAAELAASKGEASRAELARKRVKQLEPKLSRIEVEVKEPVAGLTVRLDDRELGDAVLGAALPVDPGSHQLQASAPGYEPWSRPIDILADGQTTRLHIPSLKAMAQAPDEGAAVRRDDGAPLRAAGYVFTGVGAAGMAIAGVVGLAAAGKRSAADEHCDGRFCDADGLALHESARGLAAGSTGTFVVGVAALAVGVILTVVGQPSQADKQAIQLEAGPRGGALRWRVAW